jgi:hypothetical protein
MSEFGFLGRSPITLACILGLLASHRQNDFVTYCQHRSLPANIIVLNLSWLLVTNLRYVLWGTGKSLVLWRCAMPKDTSSSEIWIGSCMHYTATRVTTALESFFHPRVCIVQARMIRSQYITRKFDLLIPARQPAKWRRVMYFTLAYVFWRE